jgi:hypothetical protein
MQELIYPGNLLVLPGQHDPVLGPAVTLLRTSILCLLAVTTLLVGSGALRRERASQRLGAVGVSRQAFSEPAAVIVAQAE